MSDFTADAVLPAAYSPEASRHAKEVTDFTRRELRRVRRVRTGSLALNVVQGGVIVLLAGALYHVTPLVRVVPVFAAVHQDGTTQFAVTTSQLPKTLNEAQIEAWLWQYLQLRESYDWASSQYAYDVVSSMSAPTVRDAYQKWANAKDKDSPIRLLGKTGSIRVRFISGDLHMDTDTYHVRYERIVDVDDNPPQRAVWDVTIRFSQHYTVPYLERVTYNPTGLTITGYSAPTPEGSRPVENGAAPR